MNKFVGVWNAPSEKRYKNFISTVADTQTVWININNPLQVWPAQIYALELFSIPDIIGIDVHEFCDALATSSIESERCFLVFPTEKDSYKINSKRLLEDLLSELERIE